ncbi:methionine ABC transporter ATP-binding protein [Chlamydia sp. 17-3921]|uniref:methionine ABC transporter ATP-binding protein n=1 Tax=Chlamydia sp. 17-3921 TaxID=2675798 RepID=UPI0019181F87|nr:methionine ABC transporter ATP-binding protein [Chlamydia sp. 17-3921]
MLKESPPIISVQNLSKKVGNQNLLSEISFSVYPKEVFGVVGHSGSGKTTLLRCLDFLETPSSGTFSIAGFQNNLKPFSRQSFAKKVAYISQNYGLFSTKTVSENIAYPLEVHYSKMSSAHIQEKVSEILNFLNLDHRKNAYPGNLSGGQKQKVAIARAIICDPEVLLCDEITSALDPRSTEDVIERLFYLNEHRGLTLVVVSHEMDVIKNLCSHSLILHNGRVEEVGATDELFLRTQNSITKELFHETSKKYSLLKSIANLTKNKELLRLGFPKDLAVRGIISHITKIGLVSVNILSGNIHLFRNIPMGFLIVVLEGSQENRKKTKAFLLDQGVIIKELNP